LLLWKRKIFEKTAKPSFLNTAKKYLDHTQKNLEMSSAIKLGTAFHGAHKICPKAFLEKWLRTIEKTFDSNYKNFSVI